MSEIDIEMAKTNKVYLEYTDKSSFGKNTVNVRLLISYLCVDVPLTQTRNAEEKLNREDQFPSDEVKVTGRPEVECSEHHHYTFEESCANDPQGSYWKSNRKTLIMGSAFVVFAAI